MTPRAPDPYTSCINRRLPVGSGLGVGDALANGANHDFTFAVRGAARTRARILATVAGSLEFFFVGPDFDPDKTGLVQQGGISIDAVPEKFALPGNTVISSGGKWLSFAALSALVFSAAHKVTASKFGGVLVQISPDGVVSTKVVSAVQAYNSSGAALAAIPAADSGLVGVATIIVEAGVADWTANADDMTDGSDLTTATFADLTAISNGTEYSSGAPTAVAVSANTEACIDADCYGEYFGRVRFIPSAGSGIVTFCDVSAV